ncbi:hypothetical protein ACKLNR_006008 [Fusarium oxysporum f. sp. zingiberi]
MAAVVTINPYQVFTDFGEGTQTFLREVKGSGTTSEQKPAEAFVLDDKSFTGLQSYIMSALKIPKTTELFKATYPFKELDQWIKTEPDYDRLHTTLVPIHDHCETYLANGINSMIGLAHAIANYAENAAEYIELLKVQMDIICDEDIPTRSEKATKAKSRAKSILNAFQKEAKDTKDRLANITEVTNTFKSQTASDSKALETLEQMLKQNLTHEKLDNPMTKYIKEMRECVLKLIQNNQKAVSTEQYVRSYKWLWDVPGLGGMILPSASEDLKEALRDYAAKNDEYMRMVAKDDVDRIHLLKSIDIARALIANIDGVTKNIAKAQESLTNISYGIALMDSSCATLRTKLESIDGEVKTESHGDFTSTIAVKRATAAWKTVLETARGFAKRGIIEEATNEEAPKPKDHAVILAASYGGQTVTELAKMQLNFGTKIVISTKDLIFPDKMQGKPKALSILYRFGDGPDSWRTFTCDTGTEQVHTLTADSSPGAEVAVNFRKDTSSRYKIHAIVYGLRQITDKAALHRVAFAAENGALLADDLVFGVNSSNDPWPGKVKTAAIFYTVDRVLACASAVQGAPLIF